ncbi:hypothetical protein WEH80_16625 [Actinomycetes bacterium KLBMP 9759]
MEPDGARAARRHVGRPPAERNIARTAFLSGDARVGADEEQRQRLNRALVSDLRRTAARYPADPGVQRLISDLLAGSAEFARLWEQRNLNVRHGDRKVVRHPQLGPITLDCDVLHVQEDDQRLIVYSAAPGSHGAQSLELLRVVGLQELSADRLV